MCPPGHFNNGGQHMFEELTKYIPDLENEDKAERAISKIEDAVYGFAHNNPKYGLKYYRDTLKSRGVNLDKTKLSQVDASSVGWLGVMGLLVAAVYEERREIGTLKALYENGSLIQWLRLLEAHDEQKNEESNKEQAEKE